MHASASAICAPWVAGASASPHDQLCLFGSPASAPGKVSAEAVARESLLLLEPPELAHRRSAPEG